MILRKANQKRTRVSYDFRKLRRCRRNGSSHMNDADQINIVSNRLPVVMHHNATGWEVEPGAGGLVQAMNPILDSRGGRLIGWPGLCVEDGDGWVEPLKQVSINVGFVMNPLLSTRA